MFETIQGIEYTVSDESPFLDGDYIRNILVLGLESKNPWNASRTTPGDPTGPRRKFHKIVSASEEIAKLDGKPAYILHKAAPRKDEDLLGTFASPKSTDKGVRMDLLCRKVTVNGAEEYHPQTLALRDNIDKKRPFGGFSPTFDFTIDPVTGEVQTILGCESIDLVPQPASVKSAVESEEPEYVTREEHEALRNEHAALESRVNACECYMAGHQAASGSESVRSDPPPPVKKIVTSAKTYAEFIRS